MEASDRPALVVRMCDDPGCTGPDDCQRLAAGSVSLGYYAVWDLSIAGVPEDEIDRRMIATLTEWLSANPLTRSGEFVVHKRDEPCRTYAGTWPKGERIYAARYCG